MKLLLDENLSHTLVGMLAHEFPSCAHVRDIGLRATEAPRSRIAVSVRTGKSGTISGRRALVIVSKDTDFPGAKLRRGFPAEDHLA